MDKQRERWGWRETKRIPNESGKLQVNNLTAEWQIAAKDMPRGFNAGFSNDVEQWQRVL